MNELKERLMNAYSSTCHKTLDQLSSDDDKSVVYLVANNPNTSKNTILSLCKNGAEFIKLSILNNTKSDLDILIELSKDANENVSKRAKQKRINIIGLLK